MRPAQVRCTASWCVAGLCCLVACGVWLGTVKAGENVPKPLPRTINYFSRSGKNVSSYKTTTLKQAELEQAALLPAAGSTVPQKLRPSRYQRAHKISTSKTRGTDSPVASKRFALKNRSNKSQAETGPVCVSNSSASFEEIFSRGGTQAAAKLNGTGASNGSESDLKGLAKTAKAGAVRHAVHQVAAGCAVSGVRQVSAEKVSDFAWAKGSRKKTSLLKPTSPTAFQNKAGVTARRSFRLSPSSSSVFDGQRLRPRVKNFSQLFPSVRLEWVKKTPLTAGKTCQLDLVAPNLGQAAAEDLAVVAFFPDTVRLTAVTPQPVEVTDHLTWKVDQLLPGEKRTFHVELVPTGQGRLEVTAVVRLTQSSSAAFKVEVPMLALQMKGPKQVMLGDPASQLVLVSNPGTGTAENVVLEVTIPEGLEHPRGKHLRLDLGSLAPGESRMVRLALVAVGGGEKTLNLKAQAQDGLVQTVSKKINVLAPSLLASVEGPSLRYVGRRARYSVKVTNTGGALTSNVQVVYRVPVGFEFQGADDGGEYDPDARLVRWFIGQLEPKQSRQLHVVLKATRLGEFKHRVAVTCEQGINTQAQVITKVDGTPSLTLRVTDSDDPVEVGGRTTYEIRVANEGTKEAKNVVLTCELADGVKLVNVQGATAHKLEGNKLVFQPLTVLPAGKTSVFRVTVQGVSAGTQRLRAEIASESTDAPLVVDELTKFYAE